jgi:hypothetical protein
MLVMFGAALAPYGRAKQHGKMTARFFFVEHTIVSYIYRFVKDA